MKIFLFSAFFFFVVLGETHAKNLNESKIILQCKESDTETAAFLKSIENRKNSTLNPFELVFKEKYKPYLLKKIENGFDINSCGAPQDSSLLGLVSYLGDLDDVKTLVSHGANLEYPRTPNGESPLILAISQNRYDVAKFLISQGADVKLTYGNEHEYSALDALASSFNEKTFNADKELEIARILLSGGVSPNKKDKNPSIEKTPLLRAVSFNRPSLFRFLLQNGGDPHIKGKNGKDSFDVAQSLKREEIIKILQEGGYGK